MAWEKVDYMAVTLLMVDYMAVSGIQSFTVQQSISKKVCKDIVL